MPMPNRQMVGGELYRYAFQGQEKDPETGKEAFQLRLWDGRIGRWLTTDPAGQYASPYLGMGNNPINGVDPDGAFFGPPTDFINKQTGEHRHVEDNINQIVLVDNSDWFRVGIYNWGISRGLGGAVDFGGSPIKPNEYGVFRFPESGKGFSRYTGAGNNENYSINGQRYNSDNYVTMEGFISLYKTFTAYNDLTGNTVFYGDISAYDHRINLGHSTHYSGSAVDGHYIGKFGAELSGDRAYINADVNAMNMFFLVAEHHGGFTSNYSFGNRFTHTGNNNQGVHKNHFHIGLSSSLENVYRNRSYGWRAPINHF